MVPPKVSDVDADRGRHLLQRAAEAGGGVGQPRAVDEQQQVVRMRELGERGDLVDRVDGPELGDLADRDDRRLHGVLAASAAQQRADERRGQLAVLGSATSMSLAPVKRSRAPHSSVLMCAVAAQMTAWWGARTAWSATTLAPVPP